jgi:hypothetical protein
MKLLRLFVAGMLATNLAAEADVAPGQASSNASYRSAPTSHRKAEPVVTQMRNLVFHIGRGVELRVDELVGHLVSTTGSPPVFDDVRSYRIDIESARVAMTPQSLTNLLNNHVFAAPNAPIKKLTIDIEGDELVQTGVLKKKVDVPFTMRAAIGATEDGRIRIHPVSLKAAGFLSKRVLDFFGLRLDRLVKVDRATGVAVDGEDLLLDPERLLPPPAIHGRVTAAWIENGVVIEQFGSAQRKPPPEPDGRFANYMYYRGGTLRFGKLTMVDADLLLVDTNQKDAFDFSPAEYDKQLIAGYSKNTAAHGLIVYMPDLRALRPGAPGDKGAEREPSERQHH